MRLCAQKQYIFNILKWNTKLTTLCRLHLTLNILHKGLTACNILYSLIRYGKWSMVFDTWSIFNFRLVIYSIERLKEFTAINFYYTYTYCCYIIFYLEYSWSSSFYNWIKNNFQPRVLYQSNKKIFHAQSNTMSRLTLNTCFEIRSITTVLHREKIKRASFVSRLLTL